MNSKSGRFTFRPAGAGGGRCGNPPAVAQNPFDALLHHQVGRRAKKRQKNEPPRPKGRGIRDFAAGSGALRPVTEADVRPDRQGAGAGELVFRDAKNKFRISESRPKGAGYRTQWE